MQSIKLGRPPCFNYLNMDRNWDVSDESNPKTVKQINQNTLDPSVSSMESFGTQIVRFCTD